MTNRDDHKSKYKEAEKAFNKELGARLKKFREKARVKQHDIAEAAGCTANYISLIERGKSRLSPFVLSAYVKTLNVSPSRLMGYDDHRDEIMDKVINVTNNAEDIAALLEKYF